MTDAFNGYLSARVMLIDHESPSLPAREEVGARQKISGNSLEMSMAQPAPRNKFVVGGNVHQEEQPEADRRKQGLGGCFAL
jgi:hypothetical protein